MRNLDQFWQKEKMIYLLTFSVFIAGLVFGILACSFLQTDKLSMLNQYFMEQLNLIALSKGQGIASKIAIEANIMDIGTLSFLGLCLIGIPFIILFIFVKGFSIGFVSCFLIMTSGWQSMQSVFISIFIPKLLYIPVLLLAAYYGIKFSYTMAVTVWPGLLRALLKYLAVMAIIIVVVTILGYLEGVLSIYGVKNILQ